jgi:hypothetical protein
MEKAYDYLLTHKDQAYSVEDLMKALGTETFPVPTGTSWSTVDAERRVEAALNTLVTIGAAEVRVVQAEKYYAFRLPVDKNTWKLS